MVISLTIFLDIAVLNWFLPYITPKSVQFGVRIPREREADSVISNIRQRYHKLLLFGSLVVFLISYALPAFLGYYTITLLAMLFETVFAHLNYYLAFRRLHGIKVSQKWFDGVTENIGAIYPDESPLRHSILGVYFIFPSLVILGTALFVGITGYAQLPALIPKSFSLGGVATGFISKGFFTAFRVTMIQAGLVAIMFTLGLVITRTRQEIDVSRPYTTFEQQYRFKSLYRDMIYTLSSLFGMSLLLFSLRQWEYPALHLSIYYIFLPAGIGYALLITAPYLLGQMGSRLNIIGEQTEDTGSSNLDDDREWRAGMFDFNRQDPSLLVGKRFGVGWTLNFANPRAWIVLGGAALAVALLVFVLLVH